MTTSTIDPVCGMTVTDAGHAIKSDYQGKIYAFCCSNCKSKFDLKPDQYLSEMAAPSTGGCGCGCGPS